MGHLLATKKNINKKRRDHGEDRNLHLFLAEDTIKQFVANHRGTYYDHVIEAGELADSIL